MNTLRTVLGILVGWIVSGVVIFAIEMTNFVAHAPTGDKSALEELKELRENTAAMKAFIESMPTGALVTVLVSWQAGAFIGGAVSALIAGRARLIHAGVIGILVLGGTILNFLDMKQNYDFSHPDWMIIAGLLLPIPVSLLAGKIVSLFFPPPSPPVPPS